MLEYSKLIALLSEEIKPSLEPDEIVQNTKLYRLLKQLSSTLEPSDSTNAWWGSFKRWSGLYTKAKIDKKRIACKPAKGFALVPFLLDYFNDEERGKYYEIHISDVGRWFTVRVHKGNQKARKIYFNMVNEATKTLPKLTYQLVNEHLPYRFRTGVIKRKYLFDPEMSKEEAEKIIKAYEKRNKQAIYPISLADYLRVASYCIKAVFPKDSKLTDLELYKKHADSRHGGMLDLPMEDKRAFTQWRESYAYAGSHPFEIIAGFLSIGICLHPPSKWKKRFVLTMANVNWSRFYLKSVKALLKHEVAFDAPDLKDTLEYLTGEILVGVNKWKGDLKTECYGNEKFVKHVKWDELELPKFKED